MSEELRECFFCGHDEARVIVVDEVTDAGCEEATVPLYAASCPYCGAAGPMALSEGEAVEAWNRRAGRTCRDFGGEEGTNGEGYDFACSVCGWCGDVTEPNFCLHCGAWVEG